MIGTIKRERHIYIFDCIGCGKSQRSTLKKGRARQGKCKDCRFKERNYNPNQLKLIN